MANRRSSVRNNYGKRKSSPVRKSVARLPAGKAGKTPLASSAGDARRPVVAGSDDKTTIDDLSRRQDARIRFRRAFDQAAIGIVYADTERNILAANRKFCEMVGYDQKEILRVNLQQISYPEDLGQDARLLAQLVAGEIENFCSEKRYVRKDGRIIWARRTVSVARDAAGAARHFIFVVEDVTERKGAEERYRTMFENAAVGITRVDLDGVLVDVNQKFCDMLGYGRTELCGKAIREITDPEDFTQGEQFRARLTRGEMKSASGEKRFVRKDGGIVWARRTISVASDPTGKPQYLISVVEDITQRKRAEQEVRRKTEVTQLLESLARTANEAATPEAALRACLTRLSEFGKWTLAHLGIYQPGAGREFPTHAVWQAKELARYDEFIRASQSTAYFRRGGRFISVVLRDKKPVWLSDLSLLSGSGRMAVALAHRLRCAFAFPVVAGGEVAAFLEFYADAPREPDPEIIAAVETIAAQLARLIEREWAQAAAARLATIVENSNDAIVSRNLDRTISTWNAGAERLFGWTAQEAIGQSVEILIPPDQEAQAERARALLESGKPLPPYDAVRRTKDGRRIDVSISRSLIKDAAGKIAGVSLVFRDIAERVTAARRRAMEYAVTAVLAEAASIEEAMPRLIRTICDAMGWAYGARWSWSEAEQNFVRREFWSDFEPQFEKADEAAWARLVSRTGKGLLRRAWLEREPTWVADIMQDQSFGRQASARKFGLHSACAFPIMGEGGIVGVMEFFGREVRQPDEMLLQVTGPIGGQIGQFIQRKEAEHALRESEETFRVTFGQANVGISITSPDLGYLQVNDKYCAIVGYTRKELLAMNVRALNRPEDLEDAVAFRRRLLAGEEGTIHREKQLVRKDGSLVWVSLVTSLVRRVTGEPKHFVSVIQDITDRKRAEVALRESEEQFRQLASNIPQVFWICDARQREMIYVSPAYERITGRPIEALKTHARGWLDAVHEEDRERVRTGRKAAGDGRYDEIFRVVQPDGAIRWVRDRAFPVHDVEGKVYRIAGIAEDITEHREAEERLKYLAHYDNLTSLPNRVLFYDRLKQELARARRNQWVAAVMFIDLDRFKNVNDTLGHTAGDELLKQVSKRLLGCVRAGDTVGRLGGDEFAMVLCDLAGPRDASVVAQKIMAVLSEPFQLEGGEVFVTASIGITLFPSDSLDQETLIRNADTAMYRAKELGRNSSQFYTPEMNARALEKLSLENSLRRALERKEFVLYFQPKANLASGGITGVEALMRWQHPELGLVSPADFMPMLEETGLIVPTGEWVIQAACAQLRTWQQSGIEPVPVAVNLSARQFQAKDLGATIARILEQEGIQHDLLELEITESAIASDTEEAAQTLAFLNALGVRVAIDDFGMGYSSLSRLKRFPLDALKIDSSFVRDITTDADDAAITRAIITMAHSLGLAVVAEGVENEEQLNFLDANGCDQIQGYYLSRPLPPEDCTALIKSGRRLRPSAQNALVAPRHG